MAWLHKLDIKRHMRRYNVDGGDLPLAEVTKLVAIELRTVPCLQVLAGSLERAGTEEEANAVLEEIYDAADDNRVWLGLF